MLLAHALSAGNMFPNTRTELRKSKVRIATADGEELKPRGCFKLEVLSSEGNILTHNFEDAAVDMPIMSVNDMSSNGTYGTHVVFRKHDGAVVDIETNATSKFVRRGGVYFVKNCTPKSNGNGRSSVFNRPEAA